MNLQAQTTSGLKWTTLSTLIASACQLSILVILARYLSPEDFGFMAIMMVVVGFSQAFMDMGISKAIIHRQDVTHSQLSSLYWLNIFSGLVLTILVFSLAPAIAKFYEHPELINPLKILSSVFFIIAMGNQYRILCQKNLQFRRMAIIDIAAALCSVGISILAAFKGYGVYALVIAMLIQSSVSSLTYLLIGLRYHHIPSLSYKHRELKGYFSFGLFQMGERSINYLSANVDNLLIGKFLGMNILGFYNLAWQLCIFPTQRINPIVNKVAFPVYARVQCDKELLQNHYQSFVAMTAIITIPLLVFLFYFSSAVVLLIYGEGWEISARLIPILALIGIVRTVGNPAGSLFLALGRADIGFWWNTLWLAAVCTTLFIAILYFEDIQSVVWVLLVVTLIFSIIWHSVVRLVANIKYTHITLHFIKTSLVCFMIGGVAHFVIDSMNTNSPVFVIFGGLILCSVIYIPYLFLFEKDLLKSFFQFKR